MVPIDPRGDPPGQGPAVLSSVRGERGERIHRLCFRAELAARYVRRAGAPSSGRRGVRAGREGQLPAAQFTAELTPGRGRGCKVSSHQGAREIFPLLFEYVGIRSRALLVPPISVAAALIP